MKGLDESTPILSSNSNSNSNSKSAEDFQLVHGKHYYTGLSLPVTSVFLIAGLLGVGVLALPYALANTGWFGIAMLFTSFIIATYNGINLGKCWNIVLERYPEYSTIHVQYPYALMGEKAVGMWMRYIVSISIGIAGFGCAVLFSILAAINIHSMLYDTPLSLSVCLWLPIIYAVLIPLSWFRSPKDFWWLPFIVAGGACIGCVLLICSFLHTTSSGEIVPNSTHKMPTTFQPYFLSFGLILFAYAGASAFPTIQHDMRQPTKFKIAVIISYSVMLFLYIPISSMGYYIYGDEVDGNVLQSLPRGPLRIITEIFFTIHVLFAIIIGSNPIAQDMENRLGVTNTRCNWKRILFRTLFMGAALFVAETLPHFGALLALVGGSSSTFNTFVAPALFYLMLHKKFEKEEENSHRRLSMKTKILNIFIIVLGLVGGAMATYSAINQLVSPNAFVPPCYVHMNNTDSG